MELFQRKSEDVQKKSEIDKEQVKKVMDRLRSQQ